MPVLDSFCKCFGARFVRGILREQWLCRRWDEFTLGGGKEGDRGWDPTWEEGVPGSCHGTSISSATKSATLRSTVSGPSSGYAAGRGR